MPEGIKKVFDFKVNLTTIGTFLIGLWAIAGYIQQWDFRLQKSEQAVAGLQIVWEQQRLENQKLQVQMEGVRVQLESIRRELERGR